MRVVGGLLLLALIVSAKRYKHYPDCSFCEIYQNADSDADQPGPGNNDN